MTSDQLRRHIAREFDRGKPFWQTKVSKTALLKDSIYYYPSPDDFKEKSLIGSEWIRKIFKVDDIASLYSDQDFDCDNFAGLMAQLIKAEHAKKKTGMEYPVFPCSLAEDHTICICMTSEGFYFLEPQTGQIWNIVEDKPNVIFIG